MQLLNCDVVVVGAGPAGSMAAKVAAENGAHVFLLEEHAEIGLPIYCAEGLSNEGLIEAGVEARPPIVCQEITKARVFAPNMSYVDLTSSDWKGYTLNRDVFDRTLAENAVDAGAKLMTETRANTVIRENGVISGVKATRKGNSLEIRAKVVIGADGHASIIRRTAGLRQYFQDVIPCAQYKLGGLNLDTPEVNEFLLGKKISPGGYAWMFPKSNEVANVGLGVRNMNIGPPIEYLKRWVASDPRFKEAEILVINGGVCPVSGSLEKYCDDGLMLVGDAAGHLIPMTGAGVHSGVVSGKMAGEVAAKAALDGDVSAHRLSEYAKKFDKGWGRCIRESRKVIEILDMLSDEDLNILAKVVTKDDIINLANGVSVKRTLTKVVARAPGKFVKLFSMYLRG